MSNVSDISEVQIYHLKIHIEKLSPMVWRRIQVRGDTHLGHLHMIFQICLGWENIHLHCFKIHGIEYAIPYFASDQFREARDIELRNFGLRAGDKFQYDYDFNLDWGHEVRVEEIISPDPKKNYPVCIAGKNASPPEDIDGILAFDEIRHSYRCQYLPDIIQLQEALEYPYRPDGFKKSYINRALKKGLYEDTRQSNDPDWDSYLYDESYWLKKDELDIRLWIDKCSKIKGMEKALDWELLEVILTC